MRYGILVLLNLPVILLAFTNLITRYKVGKMNTAKFRKQILLWLVLFAVLVSSFPIYNFMSGRPLLDSQELSAFDIIQTTAIIGLIYIVNNQRQKVEQTERYLRDFHQELSIKLSTSSHEKTKH